MSPEEVSERAERVRQAHLAERKLHKLEAKVEHGHRHLVPFRDRLVEKITTLGGAA